MITAKPSLCASTLVASSCCVHFRRLSHHRIGLASSEALAVTAAARSTVRLPYHIEMLSRFALPLVGQDVVQVFACARQSSAAARLAEGFQRPVLRLLALPSRRCGFRCSSNMSGYRLHYLALTQARSKRARVTAAAKLGVSLTAAPILWLVLAFGSLKLDVRIFSVCLRKGFLNLFRSLKMH